MKKIIQIFYFTTLTLSTLLASEAYTYNKLPEDLPKGLSRKIQGNYRIIEHSANTSVASAIWDVYDTKSYTKDSEGVIMQAPIYYYSWMGGSKWQRRTIHENYHNGFIPELVTIIDAKVKLSSVATQVLNKPLNSQQVIEKINLSLKNTIWSMKTFSYKNGLLICGVNTKVKSDTIRAIWYSTNGKIYNVNGIAKGNSPNFNITFDVENGDSLRVCQSFK